MSAASACDATRSRGCSPRRPGTSGAGGAGSVGSMVDGLTMDKRVWGAEIRPPMRQTRRRAHVRERATVRVGPRHFKKLTVIRHFSWLSPCVHLTPPRRRWPVTRAGRRRRSGALRDRGRGRPPVERPAWTGDPARLKRGRAVPIPGWTRCLRSLPRPRTRPCPPHRPAPTPTSSFRAPRRTPSRTSRSPPAAPTILPRPSEAPSAKRCRAPRPWPPRRKPGRCAVA